MQLGYFTMPLHPPGSSLADTLEHDLGQIVVLDELGYREAWVGEHFTAQWENIPAPELFIANALARTKNIVLGTGVSCLPYHDPFVLAHRIAMLDHLARGRFYWGVGSGTFPGDLEAFGFDGDGDEHRRAAREALELILGMWEDPTPGVYEHRSGRYAIPETRDDLGLGFHITPYQRPHPPIAVAGLSANSATLELAGERGWIPMSINLVPTRTLVTHWDSVEAGAQRAGRIPDRSLWRIAREVYVAETTEQARAEALEGVLGRDFTDLVLQAFPKTGQLHLLKADPDMADADVTLEYLCDELWIVGGPDEVTRKLRRLYDDVGGFGVLLAMGHEWRPRDRWVASMRTLVDEVLPRLADLGQPG